MGKGKARPELYLAFHNGFQPKQLIALGINKGTVYTYSARYKKNVKPAFERLIGVRKDEPKPSDNVFKESD